MRVLAVLLVLPLVAGCFAAVQDGPRCDAPSLTMLPQSPAARVGDEPVAVLAWGSPHVGASEPLVIDVAGALAERLEVPGGAPGFAAFVVRDAPMEVTGRAATGACATEVVRTLEPPLADAPRAEVGVGVLVRTAGFWVNGTSFYTNHVGVHADALVPKGYLGEFDAAPLPVYVYGEDASERPRRYETGGYFPTIRGFNEALKGIAVGHPRVVVIAPEDAYTAPGREEHALYGETLVFWIEALEVHDLPCPLPQPACDLPGTPATPTLPPPVVLR